MNQERTMNKNLYSAGFIFFSFLFAVLTSITAVFFCFAGYLDTLGINQNIIGLILGIDALASLIFQLIVTPIIHLRNAKYWLIGGVVLYACSLWALGNVHSVFMLFGIRIFQGIGLVCLQAPMLVMLVQLIPVDKSGQAFGVFTLVRLLPYAVIPFLFDFINIGSSDFKVMLNLAAVSTFIPLFALLIPLPEPDYNAGRGVDTGFAAIKQCLSSLRVVKLLISSLLLISGYSAIFYYIRQYGARRAIADAGMFFSLASAAMIFIRIFFSHMFDRFNKIWLSTAGIILAGASYLLIPLFPVKTIFLLLAVSMGFGWGVAMPLQAAVMFDMATPETRAISQNMLMAMLQAGFFFGPLIGGLVISGFGFTVFFMFTAAITALSALLMAKTASKEIA